MMTGPREELRDTVGELSDSQAERVLSFVHLLRARRQEASDPDSEGSWKRDLLLFLALLREGDEVPSSVDPSEMEDPWLGLSESALARDWERPEEDEAWADL